MCKTTLSIALAMLFVSFATAQDSPVTQLEKHLAANGLTDIADQAWATQAISREQAEAAKQLLVDAHRAMIEKDRRQEWDDKVITMGEHSMKFEFKVFGEKPETGRSLYISMHGGGGAPARVNTQQWRNQIGLYEPEEGVYLAPRAPTDKWNLWHEPHIDPMFTRIIENAIVFEGVDPNKVYIMGYSAGGDGVYQLAPRMADQLAAASMMAGHPNGVNPLGLRNIGFTLHMGGKDSAYKRNQIARKWKTRLAELKEQDPGGYEHEVVIHEEHGHWMQRDDAVAVPWMAKFTRDRYPTKIAWVQSGVTHDRFYWLAVDDENKKKQTRVIATRSEEGIQLEKVTGIETLTLLLTDEMFDLDNPVSVTQGSKTMELKAERNVLNLYNTLVDRGDPSVMYAAKVEFEVIQPSAEAEPRSEKGAKAKDAQKEMEKSDK